MIGFDTNLLVRYLVRDGADQAARVAELIDEAVAAEQPLFLDVIVLSETVRVLERGYDYPREVVADVIEKVLLTQQFEVEDRDGVWRALARFRQGRADLADYLVGERNLAHGCDRTVTFDRALTDEPGFEVL